MDLIHLLPWQDSMNEKKRKAKSLGSIIFGVVTQAE